MSFRKSLLLALFTFSVQCTLFADYSNLSNGQKFLEENAKKDGVVTTESGLQYKVLVAGDGERPGPIDKVEVYYHGFLLNGKEFDGTEIIRPPAIFEIEHLIAGWSEALQLMPVGSIWEVYIPSELAYGSKGTSKIPSDSTLIFEVELVSILD